MVKFAFDEDFTPPFNDLILEIEDQSLFYHDSSLPIIPAQFDHIMLTECLHESEDFTVYGGYFQDSAGNRYEAYDVAFKLGEDDKLCLEAGMYDIMSELQGKVIPRLIGLAFGKRSGEEGYLGCLMTEKFGSSLDCQLIHLARPEKAIILNHLQALHDKGLIHVDFKESNVLERASEFRLVGFDHMRHSHECTMSGKAVDFTHQPDTLSIGDWAKICAYVRVPAMDMDFYDHGTVTLKGYIWNKEGLPSRRIMQCLFPDQLYAKHHRTKALPELLLCYFKHVHTVLEKGTSTLEYLKDHIEKTAAEVEKEWEKRAPNLRG